MEIKNNYSHPYNVCLLLVTEKAFGNTEGYLFILASLSRCKKNICNIDVPVESNPGVLSELFITCLNLLWVDDIQNHIYHLKEKGLRKRVLSLIQYIL